MPSYALNVADLTMLPELPVSLLVAPHIQSRNMVNGNGNRLDEAAVVLECPEKQAVAICALCATKLSDKAQYPCRIYRKVAHHAWYKLTKSEVQKMVKQAETE